MTKILNRIKAPVSLALCVFLLFSLFGGSIQAQGVDLGNGFEMLQNDDDIIVIKGTHNQDELYGTFDKDTHEITMRAVEYQQTLLRSTSNETEYDVNLSQLGENGFEATLVDKDSNREFKLKDTGDVAGEPVVKAQLPLLIPIAEMLGAALIRHLLAAGLAVVIGTTTWVMLSEVIDKIRNNDDLFYAARIYGGYVVVAGSISYNTAHSRINTGSDVMFKSEYLAQTMCVTVGGSAIGPEIHGDGSDGYQYHYHPKKPSSGRAHAFYIN